MLLLIVCVSLAWPCVMGTCNLPRQFFGGFSENNDPDFTNDYIAVDLDRESVTIWPSFGTNIRYRSYIYDPGHDPFPLWSSAETRWNEYRFLDFRKRKSYFVDSKGKCTVTDIDKGFTFPYISPEKNRWKETISIDRFMKNSRDENSPTLDVNRRDGLCLPQAGEFFRTKNGVKKETRFEFDRHDYKPTKRMLAPDISNCEP